MSAGRSARVSMRAGSPLLLALLVGGIGAWPGAGVRAWATPEKSGVVSPPTLRLGDAARPKRYTAELTVVPTDENFTGRLTIDVEVREPLAVLWLNGDELNITRAVAESGGKRAAATVLPASKDFIGLSFARPLPRGTVRLQLEYTGTLSKRETSGAMRQKEGDEWYVFTHFEPNDARRVFPCFDEPSFKVPWQLTLRVRTGDRAFANTPMVRETDVGGGMKTVEFAPTKPLPSYLVAWAVGPFDTVDAGRSRRSNTPMRVITPRGQQAQASWAAESSVQLLDQLEDYFDSNYPYEKLDVIAVPVFNGAMENPGLVTFNASLLLNPPDRETVRRKRGYAEVATHEFAHQWFGDLVTTAWWDDLWLNEAFATWMEAKIISRWQPGWGAAEDRVGNREGAMHADSLVSARKIRQPIVTHDDTENAFDGITYAKGASVIAMFERWIGEERFRKGVQRYMREHAHGNATARDFLAAISAEAGRDMAPAFSTFLDQPGVPLVSFDLQCQAGKAPLLKLAQARYLPDGSSGKSEADKQQWQVPICVRWKAAGQEGRSCTLLNAPTGELALSEAKACPDWIVPNEESAGYYRSLLGKGQFARLFDQAGDGAGASRLSRPERIGLVGDLNALAHAGRISYDEALALVPGLARDPNRFIVETAIDLVARLRDRELFPDTLRPSYARFIRDAFGPRARELGWTPRDGEDEDTRLLRPELVRLVADQGEDPMLVAQARQLAETWLKTRSGVGQDVLEGVLGVTAKNGDRALFDRISDLLLKEPERRERRHLLGALGSFRDPALSRVALELTLNDKLDVRETIRLLIMATRTPAGRMQAYEFVKTNFDALVKRLPRDMGARFPQIGASLCSDEKRGDVESFFRDRSTQFTGGPRMLAQALEDMHLCAVFQKTQRPAVTRFLTQSSTPGQGGSAHPRTLH